MNEDLLDEKDKTIIKLKMTIDAFKKYDEERKKYIEKLQWDLEEVSEGYSMLRGALSDDYKNVWNELKKKVSDYKKTFKALNKKINDLQQIIALMNNEERMKRAENIIENYTVVQLKEQNSGLNQTVKNLRSTNRELIEQIIKLKRSLNAETESEAEG